MKLDEFLWVFIFNDCWWLLLQYIALNLERLKVVSSPRSTLVACTPDSFITSACGLPTYIRKCCPCWANWLEVWIFVSQLYLVSICFLFYGLSSLTRPSSSPIVTAPSRSHPQRLCTWCHHPIGPNSRLLRCDPSLVDVLVPLQHSTFEPASSVNNI